MEANFIPENPRKKFFCKTCNYNTCSNKDFTKHILTSKHIRLTERLKKNPENPENPEVFDNNCHECICGKKYRHSSSLCKHKKICNYEHPKLDPLKEQEDIQKYTDVKELTNLVLELVKSNNELQKQMLEICKNSSINNSTINNNCNNNNQTFNLQVFLNETCKDAMNIMDFVDSIQLQLSDLESVGHLGYVKGISNIIVKKLKDLDVTQRPVHCSDAKREVLYIKDNDVWEKEDAENNKLKKAIKYISHKNILLLPDWREKYPDCIEYDSPKNDFYAKMRIEAMGGDGSTDEIKMNKIIKNIAKEVIIQK
jgi:hypothetical protein